MTAWLLAAGAETFTDVGNAADNCNGTAATAITSGGPEASAAACKLQCATLKAWRMNAGDTFPEGLIIDGATGPSHCYGVAWGTGSCLLYPTTAVTTNGSNDGTARQCSIRNKTTTAPLLIAAAAASAAG